jgi:hypothetical protein
VQIAFEQKAIPDSAACIESINLNCGTPLG